MAESGARLAGNGLVKPFGIATRVLAELLETERIRAQVLARVQAPRDSRVSVARV